jgi:hypothetical protein
MKDVVNVIGPGNLVSKRKYPSRGTHYQVANEMLNNAYEAMRNTKRTITFDFKHLPRDERDYFYSRFQTFIDEIISTKTINEKYLLIFEYHNRGRKITSRKLLTDDTAIDIQRHISNGTFGIRLHADGAFMNSNDDPHQVPSQELDKLTIIDLNTSTDNPMRHLHEGAWWSWLNKSKFNLERYMIFKKLGRRERHIIGEDNCLTYAIRQTHRYDGVLNRMNDYMFSKCFPVSKIKDKISKEFGINIVIHNADQNDVRCEYALVNNGEPIELLLYKGHYMLYEKVDGIPLLRLLKEIFDRGLFEPISVKDLATISPPKDVIPDDLRYNMKECCHLKKTWTPPKDT